MLASLAQASCSPAGSQPRKPTGTGTSLFLTLGDTTCSLEHWGGGRGRGRRDCGEYEDDEMCILQREKPGADAGESGLLSTVSASW